MSVEHDHHIPHQRQARIAMITILRKQRAQHRLNQKQKFLVWSMRQENRRAFKRASLPRYPTGRP